MIIMRNPEVLLSVLACAFAVEVQHLPADIYELYADLLDLQCNERNTETHIGHVVKKSSDGIWVCLKIGYIPNYSHLIGIMIINHWV